MNDIFMRIEAEVIRFYEGLIPFLDKHFLNFTHTTPHPMVTHNQNNPLFTLTVYEFSELQRSILMEALKRESSKEVPENSAEYLNFTEATKYLGISKPTFSKLRKEGKIPCYRVSENRVMFSKRDLDNYIVDKREN